MQNDTYSCVVYGLESSFDEAIAINNMSRDLKLPFYGINSSGLNAFLFADLGTNSFEYQHSVKDKNGINSVMIS